MLFKKHCRLKDTQTMLHFRKKQRKQNMYTFIVLSGNARLEDRELVETKQVFIGTEVNNKAGE